MIRSIFSTRTRSKPATVVVASLLRRGVVDAPVLLVDEVVEDVHALRLLVVESARDVLVRHARVRTVV